MVPGGGIFQVEEQRMQSRMRRGRGLDEEQTGNECVKAFGQTFLWSETGSQQQCCGQKDNIISQLSSTSMAALNMMNWDRKL